jgi:hypothetical protein
MDRLLQRFQTAAAVAAVAALVLGFLASIGVRPFPPLSRLGLWVVAALLLAIGVAGGLATVARAREIDRRRWEVVEDPLITSGEREYAHKEAERERRWAGVVFFAAPIALGYWAGYQLGADVALAAPPLLAAVPLAGYLAGLLTLQARWHRRTE